MPSQIRKTIGYCIVVCFCSQFSWGSTVNAECLRLDPNQAPYFSIPDKQDYVEKEDHPLIVAAWMGDNEVVTCWLGSGTNVDIEGFRGDTALMRAAMFGHSEIVKSLIQGGANVNKQNQAGQTALHFLACASEKINVTEVARLLLDAHADMNVKDKQGETPLKIAMTKGVAYKTTFPQHYDLSLLLIRNGVDLKPIPGDPWPPLLFAILHKDVEMVRLLLKHGANPDMMNPYKQSALDIAEQRGSKDIIRLLEKAGATSSEKPEAQQEHHSSNAKLEFTIETDFVGKTIVLKPESTGPVYLSKHPETWYKKDSAASVKANTKAEILEVRTYRPGSNSPLRRFKVRSENGNIGWVSLSDLLCTSFLCDDDHPQRRFPFHNP